MAFQTEETARTEAQKQATVWWHVQHVHVVLEREIHIGNLVETFQSGPSVILRLLPQWSFNIVGLPWTSAV